jgi:hypothetical protein
MHPHLQATHRGNKGLLWANIGENTDFNYPTLMECEQLKTKQKHQRTQGVELQPSRIPGQTPYHTVKYGEQSKVT